MENAGNTNIIVRKQLISRMVNDGGFVRFAELEAALPDVSGMTIRRDMEALEKAGVLIRVRGGVMSKEHILRNSEDIYSNRAAYNVPAKRYVAERALEFAEQGRSLYLDAGSTVMMLAKLLAEQDISVVTNGINTALELAKNPNASVNVLGGRLNCQNLAVSGSSCVEFINNINIDVAFMGTSGFSPEAGFTNGNREECELKKAVVGRAKQVIMLMDGTKPGKNMLFTFAQMKDIDVLISDAALPADVVSQAKKYNIDCRIGG